MTTVASGSAFGPEPSMRQVTARSFLTTVGVDVTYLQLKREKTLSPVNDELYFFERLTVLKVVDTFLTDHSTTRM